MDFLHKLHDPEGLKSLIAAGGYLLLFAIIFAETGLLVGFFLPGDSLLFVAGTLCSVTLPGHNGPLLNIAILIPLLIVAAITGDATGYLIGRKVGPGLFARGDTRFFKRDHLLKTQAFYDKHGPKTIVLARFVPIVRTFAPTVAGIANMSYRTFATYNVVGGVGWICSMSLLGYFLGQNAWVQENLEKAVILIVVLSILPMVVHYFQERKHKSNADAVVSSVAPGVEVD
ncbi:MAG: rane-associated protein [Abditibacteriota bacterium]|jgi:membrane-associated protein|nr:rane-associated protein [Abditibacteriota bacterium]